MPSHTPRVSIGLPVHNGELYLAQAVRALLKQTFTDFELILSNNASSDGTAKICRDFAAEDDRIRYHEFETNVGASGNFNYVFEVARGEYFKWAAHDDLCAPELLDRCVEGLDRDPQVVLCHSRGTAIDTKGMPISRFANEQSFDADTPHERFEQMINSWGHGCVCIFGLMRTDVLGKTPLLAPYVGSDRTLLAELSLRGTLQILPVYFASFREHPGRSMRKYADEYERLAWFDPTLAGQASYPTIRRVLEYSATIDRVPISDDEKQQCREALDRWCRGGKHAEQPVEDLLRQECLAVQEAQGTNEPEAAFAESWLASCQQS